MALGYKVAIFNVWWRRGEVDTRFFSSKADQKTYFDSKTLYFNDLNNFNINDNITTVITFRDASGRSIDDLLKCNYAIVKDSNSNYRYFFITAIKQDAGGQVQCTLDLDDIQNNLMGNLTNLSPILVKRWNGVNYIDNDSGTNPHYDFTDNHKSYILTEDNPQLFNKNTQQVKISYTGVAAVDNWIRDNVEAWRYVFVNDNQRLVAPKITNLPFYDYIISVCISTTKGRGIGMPYGSICEPILKSTSTHNIYIRFTYNGNTCYLKFGQLDSFFNLEGYRQGESDPYKNYPKGTYGIGEKISNIPPVVRGASMSVDTDGDLIIDTNFVSDNPVLNGVNFYISIPTGSLSNLYSKATTTYAIASGYYQDKSTYECEANINLGINDIELANSKLFDFNYYRLRVRIANQFYDYNALAYLDNTIIANGKLKLEYTEVLQVGVSKMYLRLKANGEYKTPNNTDYTGVVASLDLSCPILTNQWADYLANHKNYYMQTAFNNTVAVGNSLINNVERVAGSKSGAEAMLKGVVASWDFTTSTMGTLLNTYWDRNNLQQSPNNLSNASGDPYFNYEVSGIRPMLDILDMTDNTKLVINEKLNKMGYEFDRVIDIANAPELFESHKNYEVASFIIDKINTDISEKEFNRLKIRCAALNRFWHNDDLSYFNIMLNNVKD